MVFRQAFIISSLALSALLIIAGIVWPGVNWAWLVIGPFIALGIRDLFQKKHTLLKIYPVVGHFRYLFESVRRELQQYFVESDLDGAPVNREFRSLIYQRAKKDNDTRAFGTIFDVYRDGYEWVNHSLAPKECLPVDLRVTFGGPECTRPYEASPLNISAMSYGALSRNAVMALNRGAKLGNFAHNTGEGGISDWHLEYGGDLIWQIGTGYFGCRTPEGVFDPQLFSEQAGRDVVRMIEVKLSQGAKPGHGGVLPAAKVTEEIARIRMVPLGEDVLSPPVHSAFTNPLELLHFVARLRKLSGGKPVGFKFCPGNRREFLGICKAMLETGLLPDFITVDGGEGGTGAAPVELTNSVGMPLRDGLNFVHNALRGIGVRDRIRIIASGKAFSAFHMLRMMVLGADTVNSARGMMLALGCIQSRSCNTDKCPTGITTQNPARYKQLDVTDKGMRVANYHHSSMETLAELLSILGKDRLGELDAADINRRVNQGSIMNYAQLYPHIESGCLLHTDCAPDDWAGDWRQATGYSWR
ncbi:FMN-binding glutamate synthase family protein [Marinobacter orientalis]|uniref:FMN-binding glutamate synthase family protein n=1 Tax=Marinobacter orientalis TaxID=1928859 RepID=A0A7Y0RB03_9GAMM|nr:FMN-binding glutamate synthase family protein [Marinobacter orientalis]NMT62882.1 FMN-binding glutamate synthase family protein [Marinobacter orientalis]TGX51557.1 FMN-binding glutamate synthase family protein [Marinobacter orientalis]